MQVVEHLDDQVRVKIIPDLEKGTLVVTTSAGDVIIEQPITGPLDLYVPYGSVVEAKYTELNKDILYVPDRTPDEMRTAATRRFPGMRVGV